MISHLWAGSLHLIKICYELGRKQQPPLATLAELAANQTAGFALGGGVSAAAAATSIGPMRHGGVGGGGGGVGGGGGGEVITFNAPFFIAWYCSMFNILFLPLFTFFKMFCFNSDKVTTKKIFL